MHMIIQLVITMFVLARLEDFSFRPINILFQLSMRSNQNKIQLKSIKPGLPQFEISFLI